MKKISIILVTLFAVIGAIIIYKYTLTDNNKKTDNNKINNEYTLLGDKNVFKYESIDIIANTLSKGTGIIFFCIPENDWCQYYAKYLNETAIKNNIDEIIYLNIKQDRSYNTSGYRKIINILNDYLYKDDEGNKKVFVPNLIFVKNGIITGFDNETSFMTNEYTPNTYYTNEKIDELNQKITNFIIKYKEEL